MTLKYAYTLSYQHFPKVEKITFTINVKQY